MINLLNILYLTNPDYYIKREGENIVVTHEGKRIKAFPIHIFRQVVLFNYMGISPAAMKLCMVNNIMITFLLQMVDIVVEWLVIAMEIYITEKNNICYQILMKVLIL